MTDYLKIGLGTILLLSVLVIVGTLGGVITLPFRAAHGVVERVLNPDSMIYNYEWFKQQYEDIKASEQKIAVLDSMLTSLLKTMPADRKDWTSDDRREIERSQMILTGLRNQRIGMIADYNARSQMVNRSIFMAGALPAVIPNN